MEAITSFWVNRSSVIIRLDLYEEVSCAVQMNVFNKKMAGQIFPSANFPEAGDLQEISLNLNHRSINRCEENDQ